VMGSESQYSVYRISGGVAQPVSGTYDTTNNRFTVAGVSSFSPWTLAESGPTVADVSISGRVLTADGRGIRNVTMTLIDQNGNPRTALTSSFGYYTFDNVASGQTYVLGVSAKRYRFNDSQRTVAAYDSLANVDFVAR
jgi:Carboxypeptidase regulatory-like domain